MSTSRMDSIGSGRIVSSLEGGSQQMKAVLRGGKNHGDYHRSRAKAYPHGSNNTFNLCHPRQSKNLQATLQGQARRGFESYPPQHCQYPKMGQSV
ncbi:hypothetical protein ACHAXR_008221 [Thalassiosira sp. AJA248-18]